MFDTGPSRAEVEAFDKDLREGIAGALKTLLEEKHLYQSVHVKVEELQKKASSMQPRFQPWFLEKLSKPWSPEIPGVTANPM